MAEILVRNLNPETVERLEVRARSHGRTLQAEAKAILEAEAAAPLPMKEARRIAQQWQQRLAGRVTGDSADLIRDDREQ
jgi:antitoxin FitA